MMIDLSPSSPDKRVYVIAPRRLTAIALYSAIYIFLSFTYSYGVMPIWRFYGFEQALNPMYWAICFASSAIIAGTLPIGFSVRNLFLQGIFFTSVLPAAVLFPFSTMPPWSLGLVILAFLAVFATSFFPIPKLSASIIRMRSLLWIILASIVIFVCCLFYFGVYRYFNLDIRRVYEYRADAVASLPSVFNYFTSIFIGVLIPFAVAMSMETKSVVFTVVIAAISVFIYATTGIRWALISPALCISIFLFFRAGGSIRSVQFAMVAVTIVGVICTVFVILFGNIIFPVMYLSIGIRRALFVPSILDYYFIEYFSTHHLFLWSTSQITFGLITPPYASQAPRLIGEAYFHSSAVNANTGFIGSGFAQAGIAGTLLYSVGLGLVVSLLQSVGSKFSNAFLAVIFVNVIEVINSSDFLTIFLTHGLALLLLLLVITRGNEETTHHREIDTIAGRAAS